VTTLHRQGRLVSLASLTAAVLLTREALAQSETPEPAAEPPPSPPAIAPAPELAPPAPEKPVEKPLFKLTPTGYVEAYYAYNFNRPSNGITNFRDFDNRHNTFTLSNAVLGTSWEAGPISGKVLAQVGSTPSTYYLGEPALGGASGANATGPDLWKYLQEAWVSYEGRALCAGEAGEPCLRRAAWRSLPREPRDEQSGRVEQCDLLRRSGVGVLRNGVANARTQDTLLLGSTAWF
jgi:hypothetical protein